MCVCVCGGGGGGGHADPEIRGVAVLKKNVLAPRASVWAKNKGGGAGPLPAPPLDPSLHFLLAILRIKGRPVLHLLFNENSFSNPHVKPNTQRSKIQLLPF